MLLGANFAWAKKRGGIPADCVEVAWLETDKTQYTYVLDNSRTDADEFSLDVAMTSNTGRRIFCGGGTGNSQYLEVGTNGLWTTNQNAGGVACVAGKRTKVEARADRALYVDGTKASFTFLLNLVGTSAPTNPFAIGRAYGYGSALCAIRIYGATFSLSGKLVRDLVPVRRVEGGVSVGYLCDVLTGKLYGNAGTGAFVIGPDKGAKTARDYVQDGLVAMWDGIENAAYHTHSDSATAWVDLVNGMNITADCTAGENYVTTSQQKTIVYTKTLWTETHQRNMTQSVLVDMDSVATNTFFCLLYCYASPAAYRYGINLNSARRLTGDHLPLLTADVSSPYTSGVHRFDHTVEENADGGTDEKLYIDGVEIVSARRTTAFSATDTTQARFFFYKDVKYYNYMHYTRPLTAEEIAKNYLVDKLRFGLEEGKKTARDYKQDGLVAMWDGIENAGWGVHDGAATVWTNLISGETTASGATFAVDKARFGI